MMPYISVIVPTHKRASSLATCLSALAAQDYPPDQYEVIVVNNGDPDALPLPEGLAVRPGVTDPPNNICFLYMEKADASAARNSGAQAATGSLLAFTDDDCVPSPSWLSAFARAHLLHPTALLGGITVNSCRSNPQAEFAQCVADTASQATSNGVVESTFFPSCNIAAAKDAFIELGGFDTGFDVHAAEDRNFCARWRSAGYPSQWVTAAIVGHAHSLNIAGAAALYFRYARGALQNSRLLGSAALGGASARLAQRKALRQRVVWSKLPDSSLNQPRGALLYALWEVVSLCGFTYEAVRQVFSKGLISQLMNTRSLPASITNETR